MPQRTLLPFSIPDGHKNRGGMQNGSGQSSGAVLTSSVKMASLPLSNMSSSSSLVVVLPAADRRQTGAETLSELLHLVRHVYGCMRRALTDLQLSLDAVLAAVAVLGLCGVVLSHHLHKLT